MAIIVSGRSSLLVQRKLGASRRCATSPGQDSLPARLRQQIRCAGAFRSFPGLGLPAPTILSFLMLPSSSSRCMTDGVVGRFRESWMAISPIFIVVPRIDHRPPIRRSIWHSSKPYRLRCPHPRTACRSIGERLIDALGRSCNEDLTHHDVRLETYFKNRSAARS